MNVIEQVIQLIDLALENSEQRGRNYLGASQLGVACERQLQFSYWNKERDTGQTFTGKQKRIFEAGHVFESLMGKWLCLAGFELETEFNGEPIGFAAMSDRFRGHVDGIVLNGPEDLALEYPMLWESKSLNNKSFNDTQKKGLAFSKPIYAAQIALYQAYLEDRYPGISANPVLFTAINKDSADLYVELILFDCELAQRASDKAVRIIEACEADELLPRCANDKSFYICKMCPYAKRCWQPAR